MIKKWDQFNESKIQSKIDLLNDLSMDLSDMGLKIDVWNGTWKDNGNGYGLGGDNGYNNLVRRGSKEEAKAEYELPSKSIIMMIVDDGNVLDDDDYYENSIRNKEEILNFESNLKSYGMIPKKTTGFGDRMYLFFDKRVTPKILR